MIKYVYDKELLRRELSIPYAALQYGLLFDQEDRALCPFHDDAHNPNLELMVPGEDGIPWYFCRACGASGDVLGIIAHLAGVGFSEAIQIASDLYRDQPDDVPRGPTERTVKYEVTDDWYRVLEEYRARATQHSDVGLLSYTYGFLGEDAPQEERTAFDLHLVSWGWGLDSAANVVIPHYDRLANLTAVKVRHGDGGWSTFGKLADLYGAWRERLHDAVLICEGESDCVWANYQANRANLAVDCLALPRGAGGFDESWMELVSQWPEDRVVLGFDADIAGDEASTRWSQLLPRCRRAKLPPNTDIRSSGLDLPTILKQSG